MGKEEKCKKGKEKENERRVRRRIPFLESFNKHMQKPFKHFNAHIHLGMESRELHEYPYTVFLKVF